jgi:hypothetical protein
MTDRVNSIDVGQFTVHVDRDHRGRFRGQQAMDPKYRGWHYHVGAIKATQTEIFIFLERQLKALGAHRIEGERLLHIGNVEHRPFMASLWQLEDRTAVLWISAVTGTLHIEADKKSTYTKGIITKNLLIKWLRLQWRQPHYSNQRLMEVAPRDENRVVQPGTQH